MVDAFLSGLGVSTVVAAGLPARLAKGRLLVRGLTKSLFAEKAWGLISNFEMTISKVSRGLIFVKYIDFRGDAPRSETK